MMDSRKKRTSRLVGPVAALLLLVGSVTDDPVAAQEPRGPSPLGQYFGFQPVEIFKLELRSSNLVARDIDRDGLVDLVLADNNLAELLAQLLGGFAQQLHGLVVRGAAPRGGFSSWFVACRVGHFVLAITCCWFRRGAILTRVPRAPEYQAVLSNRWTLPALSWDNALLK